MSYPIHDLFVHSLNAEPVPGGERFRIVRYSDHLLRRFGLAEVLRLEANHQRPPTVRQVADELWALIHGTVEFVLHDQRDESPSAGKTYHLQSSQPALVLVPFGVAVEIRAIDGPAELIRLATHEESAPND
jgi:hypothetical protein